MVIGKPVPAVAPERGAEGLLPYRAHAYCDTFSRNTSFSATRHCPSERRRQRVPRHGSYRAVDHLHARGIQRRTLERKAARDCRMTSTGTAALRAPQHLWKMKQFFLDFRLLCELLTDQRRSCFVLNDNDDDDEEDWTGLDWTGLDWTGLDE